MEGAISRAVNPTQGRWHFHWSVKAVVDLCVCPARYLWSGTQTAASLLVVYLCLYRRSLITV